jgi:hypothetical protein
LIYNEGVSSKPANPRRRVSAATCPQLAKADPAGHLNAVGACAGHL